MHDHEEVTRPDLPAPPAWAIEIIRTLDRLEIAVQQLKIAMLVDEGIRRTLQDEVWAIRERLDAAGQ